mmetsp:Transcript_12736/g.18268  ORF Transcript_12736/g.18268 Transcript_12736/m.18268 type:complete len:193 (-) Transcript_12736:111-689(-)|eukprot:CAMPEP_0172423618 /NCGR_PEP_ID=MMETSP1064-20121228/17615_1 /TAXON_ID=202472 /ORGANISM="Aulacoseira subarctica , Strain CCAP 1002/5" /LENGTH=192 /DNA_ID=CAMNT_0013165077 /DNA_START=59 /DNA_END=637 /DNA_ORIENTATION=+
MTTGLPPYDLALDEHSVALSYILMASGKSIAAVAPAAPAPAAPAAVPKKVTKKVEEDDDDFDVFGEDEDDNKAEEEAPKESRAEMLARLKAEAESRTAAKEAKQRTLVAIEVKPWSTEQDLNVLWKKITTEVVQDGLKWGEGYHTPEVAFGIKKLCMTFTMGVNNSSDDVVEAIQDMEDEVQSVEVTSMNVL